MNKDGLHSTRRQQAFRERMKKERKEAVDSVKFYYWLDTYTTKHYRVWQMGTPGDVFDVIPDQDIEILLWFFRHHPDMFVNEEPPEDDEG